MRPASTWTEPHERPSDGECPRSGESPSVPESDGPLESEGLPQDRLGEVGTNAPVCSGSPELDRGVYDGERHDEGGLEHPAHTADDLTALRAFVGVTGILEVRGDVRRRPWHRSEAYEERNSE